MTHWKKINLFFVGVLVVFLLSSVAPAAQGFITLHHDLRKRLDGLLINKVHEPFWTIHYSFDKCEPVDKETRERYEQIMTKFIQSWLQPLREYTERPIVNDFRYKMTDDPTGADFSVIHICEAGSAFAFFGPLKIKNYAPEFNLAWRGTMDIVHELGHLFGLADTYLLRIADEGKPGLDTGALNRTRGSQPDSIMSGAPLFTLLGEHRDFDELIPVQGLMPLSQDDINGLIWLYKFTYEGLALEDCFYPNYEIEESPFVFGCVPKYTLIFELKFGHEYTALRIIEEDEGLDVNVQDADGMTALHHALLNQFEEVIKELLARPDIKPSLKNNEGLTPLQLARELKLERIAQLIAAHPQIMSVNAKGKLTTWGNIKQSY